MNENQYIGSQDIPGVPPTSDEKTFAVLSHILTLVFPVLAPLIIFIIKKDESAFVTAHAKESLNFQITVMIVCLILLITLIGILLLWIVGIVALVFVIIATINAGEGKFYRYPFTWRIIK